MPASHSIDGVSLFDLRKRIKKFQSADLRHLTLSQIKPRLGLIMDAYSTLYRPLKLTGVWRARKNVPGREFANVAELWYPPVSAITKLGRLNNVGECVFYSSNKANVAAYETQPVEGDVISIMKVLTKEATATLEGVEVGLFRSFAPEIQHLKQKSLPQTHAGHLAMLGSEKNQLKWKTIDAFLCNLLLADVPSGEEHLYKPTIALADILRTIPGMDAINYPSVATGLHGLNLCVRPEVADRIFRPAAFYMLQIEKKAGPLFKISPIKKAGLPDAIGNLTWEPVIDVLACMQEISQGTMVAIRK